MSGQNDDSLSQAAIGIAVVALILGAVAAGIFVVGGGGGGGSDVASNCPSGPEQYAKGESAAGVLSCAQVDVSQITGNIVNSATIGANLLTGALTYAATSPITVANVGNTITWACATSATTNAMTVDAGSYVETAVTAN